MFDLKVGIDIKGDRALLAVNGELDAASSPVLTEAIEAVEVARSDLLIIDLTELSFMDSTGISVLVQARNRVCDRDGDFHVVNVSGGPRRALEHTGLYDLMVAQAEQSASEESRSSA